MLYLFHNFSLEGLQIAMLVDLLCCLTSSTKFTALKELKKTLSFSEAVAFEQSQKVNAGA